MKDFEIPCVEQVTDPVVIDRLQKHCQKLCNWHRCAIRLYSSQLEITVKYCTVSYCLLYGICQV